MAEYKSSSGKRVAAVLLTIPLLALMLGLFAALLGLGSWGIIESINQDPCGNRNLTGQTGCTVQTSLSSQDTGEQLTDFVLPWYTWMGACTGVGIAWAIVTTLAFQSLLWTVEVFDKEDEDKPSDDVEMQTLSASSPATSPGAEGTDDHDGGVVNQQTITILGPNVGGHVDKQELDKKPPLRTLTVGGVFGMFFSLLFFTFGLLCLLWGIATSYGNTRRDDVVLSTYVTVEILTAVVMPICFFAFGILFAGVLDFITWGRVDLRTLVPKFLPVVKFVAGVNEDKKHYDYWIIEDTFYFQVKKRNHFKQKKSSRVAGSQIDTEESGKPSFADSFDKSWPTWSLNFIVCLGVHLSVAYFVDVTLDQQDTIQAPRQCDTIDSTYRCFAAVTLDPIADCSLFNGTAHCFRFLRFGIDADIISSAATAFAFHLVALAAFTWLFTIMKVLLQIKPSRWWGLLYLIAGIIGALGAIALIAAWTTGFAAETVGEIAHFNVINVAQFCMICEYLFIVGLLLVAAKWWENVPVHHHTLPVKKELVQYEDAKREEVTKAANVHAHLVESGKEHDHPVTTTTTI